MLLTINSHDVFISITADGVADITKIFSIVFPIHSVKGQHSVIVRKGHVVSQGQFGAILHPVPFKD